MAEAERICALNDYCPYEEKYNPFTGGRGTEAQVRKFRLQWNYFRGSYLRFEDCITAYGADDYLINKDE